MQAGGGEQEGEQKDSSKQAAEQPAAPMKCDKAFFKG